MSGVLGDPSGRFLVSSGGSPSTPAVSLKGPGSPGVLDIKSNRPPQQLPAEFRLRGPEGERF